MKLSLLFRKRWLWLYLPVLLGSALMLWLAASVWLPLPPKSLLSASYLPTGAYTTTALRYRELVEARGIRVDTITTEGIAAPLQRLLAPQSEVDVGFAQGLLALPNIKGIVALAAIERQPVWIFTRNSNITSVAKLKGSSIAISAAASTSQSVLELLLQHEQLKLSDISLSLKDTSAAAAAALTEGKVDAVVIVASGESDVVRLLTREPGIQMMGVERVALFASRDSKLKPFVLPQGAIEIRGDIPSRDLAMVATNLHLLVQEAMHPALQRVLIDVAREIHEMPSFLQRQGEFPTVRDVDFPVSSVAVAAANGDRPWLEKLLPYWWAQFAELMLYAILPILALTVLLLLWIPSLFSWKVNAALQNFYGELKFLETDIEPTASSRPIEIKNLLQRLDEIEAKVTALDLPNSYANRWYTLREHIARARDKLLTMRAR
jgi:NMT1-like family